MKVGEPIKYEDYKDRRLKQDTLDEITDELCARTRYLRVLHEEERRMSVTLAESAGFCFGVRRAVEKAEECARERASACTLGPIIHNKFVTQRLEIWALDRRTALRMPAPIPL